MEKRELGRTGLKVAPVIFGGNVLGWTLKNPDAPRILDEFVGAGFNAIDTADCYSEWVPGHVGGESEDVLGGWLKNRPRAEVIIFTKVGMEMGDGSKGLAGKRIIQSMEQSLRRLQTDYVDLYQAHEDDRATPLDETLEAFTRLIKDGKVRAIGCSHYRPERLAEALKASAQHNLARFDTYQCRYNLIDRSIWESDIAPVCAKANIGMMTFYSLAQGFLSGKYRSQDDLGKSVRGPLIAHYLNARGLRILDALERVAQANRLTMSQAAIAWVFARPGVSAVTASATSSAQLRELVGAATAKLDEESLALLNDASRADPQ